MSIIAVLFASGHAADIVLTVIAVEFLWLVARGGWSARDALLRLLPGALMVVALRASLVGADWQWIALPLMASLPVHLLDLFVSTPTNRSAGV